MNHLYRILAAAAIVLCSAQGSTKSLQPARPGFDVVLKDDVLVISKIIDETSAKAEGLKVGDQLLRVDQRNVIGMKVRRVAPILRGLRGSSVELTVLPRMQMLPRKVNVKRDVEEQSPTDTGVTTGEALRRLTSKTAKPSEPARTATLQVIDVTFLDEGLDKKAIDKIIDKKADDVAQCAKSVTGFPDEPAGKFEVAFSMKGEGYVGIRVKPVDIDVQVCIAAKASHWQLPPSRKKGAKFVVKYVLPHAKPAK